MCRVYFQKILPKCFLSVTLIVYGDESYREISRMSELVDVADAVILSHQQDEAAVAALKAADITENRQAAYEKTRYSRRQKPFFSLLQKSEENGDKTPLVCGVLGAAMVASVAVAAYLSGDPGLDKAALIASVAALGVSGFLTLGINKAKEAAAKALLQEHDKKIEKENKYIENDPEKSQAAKERLLDHIDDHVKWGNFYQGQLDKARKLKTVGYAAGATCAANLLYVAYNVGKMVVDGGDASVVAFGAATGIVSFSGKILFAVCGKESGGKMLTKELAEYHKKELRGYEKRRAERVIAKQKAADNSEHKNLEKAVKNDWQLARLVMANTPVCERVM